MAIWLASAMIAAAGAALILWRRQASQGLGLVFGGHTPVGFMVAAGVTLILLAVVALIVLLPG